MCEEAQPISVTELVINLITELDWALSLIIEIDDDPENVERAQLSLSIVEILKFRIGREV